MSGLLGIVMLTAVMAATGPNITSNELQKNCERLATENFNRKTANDEDRIDYRAHYNVRLKNVSIGKPTYLTRLWVCFAAISCRVDF